jgi:hypothetical protein
MERLGLGECNASQRAKQYRKNARVQYNNHANNNNQTKPNKTDLCPSSASSSVMASTDVSMYASPRINTGTRLTWGPCCAAAARP